MPPLSTTISNAITGGRAQAFLSDDIFDVVFDVVSTFTESDSSTVSIHTIEDGADIADNVKKKPKTINISAIMTDDDWDLLDPFSFFDETMEDRFSTLELWMDGAELLTYYGHETDIYDVIMTNVTRNKTLDTGSGWGVDISLQVVSVVGFEVAAISLSSAIAKGATSKGTSKKAGTATAGKNKSILSSLL